MMNRGQIIQTLLENYSKKILKPKVAIDFENEIISQPIVVFITDDTSNTIEKHPLTQEEYIAHLGKSSFFIAAPGFAMPHSHNLIESMFMGCIPMLNYADFLHPPLKDMHNCITFNSQEELKEKIELILSFSEEDICKMRMNVLQYCDKHLSLKSFSDQIFQKLTSQIVYINDEVYSVEKFLENKNEINP